MKKARGNSDENEKRLLKENMLEEKATKIKSDLAFYMILIAIVFVAIILRCFFISSYTVSGTSMSPTLEDGSLVWVNKLAKPNRGDIVVAYDEFDDKALVKRVVAVQGDKITLAWSEEGYVLVIETADGEIITENYEGVDLPAIRPDRIGVLGDVPYLVTDGYFLMGDNRNDSNDSRNPQIQVFSYDTIIGVVIGG